MFEYLDSGEDVWTHAKAVIKEAKKGNLILGTASGFNEPKFESFLLSRVQAGIRYTRWVCFSSDEIAANAQAAEDSLAVIGVLTDRQLAADKALDAYMKWYEKKFLEWRRVVNENSASRDVARLLSEWYQVLEALDTKLGALTLRRYHDFMPMEFLIFSRPDGKRAALLAFPDQRHGVMEKGFLTNRHELANSLSLHIEHVLKSGKVGA